MQNLCSAGSKSSISRLTVLSYMLGIVLTLFSTIYKDEVVLYTSKTKHTKLLAI